jgi:excinuclease ABC subunit A
MPLRQAQPFFAELQLPGAKQAISEKIVREIANRVQFLNNVGLDYLSLTRSADTLSGASRSASASRARSARGSPGVMYVLDEPSIGLHQRDNERLIETLKRLRDIGNSVIVVEHDEEAIAAADHVVDMGPGAGVHGGEIVAQGTPQDIARIRLRSPASTFPGASRSRCPARRHAPPTARSCASRGARQHLKT